MVTLKSLFHQWESMGKNREGKEAAHSSTQKMKAGGSPETHCYLSTELHGISFHSPL
jgi:hypothetical protein